MILISEIGSSSDVDRRNTVREVEGEEVGGVCLGNVFDSNLPFDKNLVYRDGNGIKTKAVVGLKNSNKETCKK